MMPMSRVNTVLGTIPAAELGFVAVHEHIGYGMPGCELDSRWWKSPEQRYEETVPKLRLFHQNAQPYGAATFVEATGICNGRDIDYYRTLSARTGVHIVASTGFVGGDTALPFFERASVEYLTRQFIHEITVGIGDSGAKAGIIKVGVSRGFRMKELDKRIYRAAARAAKITGAPIFTHLAVDSEPALGSISDSSA
jgi:phosphotriesterase-related protein